MKKIVLGPEHDQKLHKAVLETLKEQGATFVDKSGDIAGSQQVSTLRVKVGGSVVTFEAETYGGLSVSGDDAVVDKLKTKIIERHAASKTLPPTPPAKRSSGPK